MAVSRAREKSVLSRQDIASRRRALAQQKMKASPVGHRAIVGVGMLTVSVLALLSVATFSAHDRVGPGFQNAIGPVGHAIAEALRGFLGVGAWVLPVAGLYTAALLFARQPKQRRWPQVLCLGLLLVSGAVLAQLIFKDERGWAHAPGGLLGREVGGALAALFSTVGTIVLVSALASVALIVGTQFAFLRLCAFVWSTAQVIGKKLKLWGFAFHAAQKSRHEERKVAAAKAADEEAVFLAQLEEQDAELAELEASAEEADAIAEENALMQREAEKARLMGTDAARMHRLAEKELVLNEKLVERDARVLERDALKAEREGLRAAREAAKELQRLEKEQQLRPMPAPIAQLTSTLAARMQSVGEDPVWASQLGPRMSEPPTPVTHSMIQSAGPSNPPPQRRAAPAIVMPPAAPPQAFDSLPPIASESIGSIPVTESTPAFAAPGPASALSVALARTPIIVEPKAPPKPTKKSQEQFEFVGDRKSFVAPPMDVLEANQTQRVAVDKEAYLSTAAKLSAKLRDFGIDGDVVEIRPGPVVTMYEFKPAPGIKISRIASLSDDLAMAMEAMRVRIVAPIPGKGVVGIEVPNKDRETVFLKEIAEQDAFQKSTSRLTMCLGKDIEGMPYVFDLAKAPHLLIAGTTGSGKSVAVNAMIMSILLKSTPEEVRFIMVDPKMLELSVYEGIPHLLLPVVTDPRKAAIALQWAVDEMTRRYKLLSEAGVRNIAGYNAMLDATTKKPVAPSVGPVIEGKIVIKPHVVSPLEAKVEVPALTELAAAEPAKAKRRKLLIVDVADESTVDDEGAAPEPVAPAPSLELGVAAPREVLEDPREGLSPEVAAALQETVKEAEIRVDEPTDAEAAALAAAAEATSNAEAETAKKKLPYIVVIIDELADLMMVASKEVETSVARLAQMARAAGIHLMVATQRPSTDVVTGVIKANFPTRITFMLRSKPDSMTVLGTVGAEALLGMGDMLILPPTSAHLQRVHGCYVSEVEIKRAVDHLKAQGKPVYDESILKARDDEGATDGGEEDELSDELYDQAVAIVSEMRQVSISMLQRKMRIGYNRAARMIERMERDGMVGAADGAKPRDVLIRAVGDMPGMDAM